MPPCGTPDVILTDSDLCSPIFTICDLPVKNDMNQATEISSTPYIFSFSQR